MADYTDIKAKINEARTQIIRIKELATNEYGSTLYDSEDMLSLKRYNILLKHLASAIVQLDDAEDTNDRLADRFEEIIRK